MTFTEGACISVRWETEVEEMEREAKAIDEGEAWQDDDEVVVVAAKRPLDKVIPVRVSAEDWEQLRHEAGEVGVGPTTLVRIWLLERLRRGSSRLRAG